MTPSHVPPPDHHQGFRDAVARRMAADHEEAAFPADELAGIEAALARRTARTPGANLGGRLRALEQAADIDVEPPVASEHRYGRGVKVGIAKLTNWHVGYLATQVRDLGTASARAVRALAARTDDLERRVHELERPDPGARS